MISVSEAEKLIFQIKLTLKTELVPLSDAIGRVLAEDVSADRPFPPFDRVAMDGITVGEGSFQEGDRFEVKGIQAAGAPTTELTAQAMEVMTGAILPVGGGSVIPYEHLSWEETEGCHVAILQQPCKAGQNIHRKGSDRPKGDLLIAAGRKISSPEIATLATVGKAEVRVQARPKVAIVSTGDELVEVAAMPLPHQIRKSNSPMLVARLAELGIEAQAYHLNDDRELLKDGLEKLMQQYEVLLFTGGVSMGKFDFVPEVLDAVGVRKSFHKVKQRPGKPFWFGAWDSGVVFALPGNPVSSFFCFERYFIPWFYQQQGRDFRPLRVRLSSEVVFKPALTRFLEVSVRQNAEGIFEAAPRKGGGSGDLAKLNEVDGFIELPAAETTFHEGTFFDFYGFRQ
ncbi:molybdopterin molybdotransferase MoeA [Persicobacter psychrovividus]|uniref:Molybdopterin molybdenumtransferase n=1 Tax=Persicobacter psychrovividus TaxID=387638 RepID=A0ABN6LB88_9BACT|nr:molybdopterin molybdenumtransferase MoeA [Persicobacter psychrovividus]